MPKHKVPRVQEPDKLTRVLLAGYRFSLIYNKARGMFQVTTVQADAQWIKDIYGPVKDGALATFDRAVLIATTRLDQLESPKE